MNLSRKISIILLVSLLAGCGSSVESSNNKNARVKGVTETVTSLTNYGHFVVDRVVDGDSIYVRAKDNSRRFEVRLYEVDTPETHDPRKVVQCFGPEASRFTKSFLPPGTIVILKPDPLLDKIDKYHRVLAYVFKRNSFLNLKLVKRGYARVYHFRGSRGIYASRIDNAQDYARLNQLGFWSKDTCDGNTLKPEPVGGFPNE